jgi:hypothetical protein
MTDEDRELLTTILHKVEAIDAKIDVMETVIGSVIDNVTPTLEELGKHPLFAILRGGRKKT